MTRSSDRSPELVDRLVDLGASVVAAPVLATTFLDSPELAVALRSLGPGDLVALTSSNGVEALVRSGVEPACAVAAVGRATAAALESNGLAAAIVPERQTAANLASTIGRGGGRVVFVAADAAGPDLERGLEANGWRVDRHDVYRTELITPDAAAMNAAARCDCVTFTSGSTAQGWRAAGGEEVPGVSIGPSTTRVAESIGLAVAAEAATHDVDGLIAAVVGLAGTSS
ncbi:MAG: uroporphyrinogen-III synthase [Actinomycetia bacterium]|nr:uroporphyrinogen-III synthase [Actinomycetes bacterium]